MSKCDSCGQETEILWWSLVDHFFNPWSYSQKHYCEKCIRKNYKIADDEDLLLYGFTHT